jgi:hypothetical protein
VILYCVHPDQNGNDIWPGMRCSFCGAGLVRVKNTAPGVESWTLPPPTPVLMTLEDMPKLKRERVEEFK